MTQTNNLIFLESSTNTIAVMEVFGEPQRAINKSLPAGTKYKFVELSELPEDVAYMPAWEFDFENNFDGISTGEGYIQPLSQS